MARAEKAMSLLKEIANKKSVRHAGVWRWENVPMHSMLYRMSSNFPEANERKR